MKNPKDSFLRGRIRSLKFAFKGFWILVSTEDSIKAQLFFAFIATILGFYFDISAAEWSAQVIVIGLVLVAEGANTAIEEMADFVHPEYHKKIGLIKDIAAGVPTIAALTSLVIACIIYVPKIMILF
ncbi:MAG: diacylglycerol kinase family protein [Polaribacter sp.]|uniref:diacylglycerol kinase family protein n=1 Tax=Polaribacter sp. TaxID=1920175 RepID=UPI003BB0B04E